MTHCNTALLIFYLRGGEIVSYLVIISRVLQIYVLGFSIEHKFLKGRDLPWMPPIPPGSEDAADVVSFVLNEWRNSMKNKMALPSSGHCRPAGTVPAAHSFSHLAPPLAPVKLGLETSLYTVRGSFRCPEITHSTPASTGTKKVLHEALAVCFSGSRNPMALLSCASHALVCIPQGLLLKEWRAQASGSSTRLVFAPPRNSSPKPDSHSLAR